MNFQKSISMIVAACPVLWSGTGSAYAHLGHLGELGGHGHWIGVGAVIVAGTLGAMLGRRSKGQGLKDDDGGVESGEEIVDDELGGEASTA